MIAGLIALLKNDATIGPIVGNERVYDSVLSYGRGWTFPALALREDTGSQEYDLAGAVDGRMDQYEISAYADTPQAADDLREAVRASLSGYSGTLPDGTKVTAIFIDRPMDLPFLPKANASGNASRKVLDVQIYRL